MGYTAIMSHPSIQRVRKIANLMDSAFTVPVIRKKIGLDPILGMIPGGGDTIALLIALYTVWVAYEVGMPRPILLRMLVNVLVDTLIGLIPVVGDISDFFFKSNMMNLKLLEEAYAKGLHLTVRPQGTYTVVDVTAE